jgi:hypothetical protein
MHPSGLWGLELVIIEVLCLCLRRGRGYLALRLRILDDELGPPLDGRPAIVADWVVLASSREEEEKRKTSTRRGVGVVDLVVVVVNAGDADGLTILLVLLKATVFEIETRVCERTVSS